jgi:hypothetical protein
MLNWLKRIMWTFEISTGRMFDPSGALAGTGYAGGDLGKRPDAVNNPDDEDLRNIGPLPEGNYTFGLLVLLNPHMGHFCFSLIPDPGTNMMGRSGFWCHGDTNPPGNASEGCIVMPLPTREAMYSSSDHELQVVGFLPPSTQTDTPGPS